MADRSGLLVARVDRHGARSHGLDLLSVRRLVVGDSALTIESACRVVIHHDLIVVSRGDDLVLCGGNFKTPDFALKVRLDEAIFGGAVRCHDIFELEN